MHAMLLRKLSDCAGLFGDGTIDQSPDAAEVSGIFAATTPDDRVAVTGIALMPNVPTCSSTKDETTAEFAAEPVTPFGGVDAKLSIPNPTPTEQRANAMTTRGLK